MNVWLCQLCELQAGCGVYTTVWQSACGVYTYGHKQNLERKPWSPRWSWPFDLGAELVCINKTEQLNIAKKKKKADAPETVYEAGCEIEHVMEHFFSFYRFTYERKYKIAKSLLRCCAYKYVNTCVQVFDVDHTTELKTRNRFHCPALWKFFSSLTSCVAWANQLWRGCGRFKRSSLPLDISCLDHHHEDWCCVPGKTRYRHCCYSEKLQFWTVLMVRDRNSK